VVPLGVSDDVVFFSSDGRHTSWPRDWSSDVCSSDLAWFSPDKLGIPRNRSFSDYRACLESTRPDLVILCPAASKHGEWVKKVARSEERRVGKGCRKRWSRYR